MKKSKDKKTKTCQRLIKTTKQRQAETSEDNEKGLRFEWIKFIEEYLKNGRNGQEAYKVAYPNVKDDNVAKAAASRLLTNVNVKNEISYRLTAQTVTDDFIYDGFIYLYNKHRDGKMSAVAQRSLEALGKMKGLMIDNKRVAFSGDNPANFPQLVAKENADKFKAEVDSGNRIAE
jgi:hypothetical protein